MAYGRRAYSAGAYGLSPTAAGSTTAPVTAAISVDGGSHRSGSTAATVEARITVVGRVIGDGVTQSVVVASTTASGRSVRATSTEAVVTAQVGVTGRKHISAAAEPATVVVEIRVADRRSETVEADITVSGTTHRRGSTAAAVVVASTSQGTAQTGGTAQSTVLVTTTAAGTKQVGYFEALPENIVEVTSVDRWAAVAPVNRWVRVMR